MKETGGGRWLTRAYPCLVMKRRGHIEITDLPLMMRILANKMSQGPPDCVADRGWISRA